MQRKQRRKTIHSKDARPLLEHWRKGLKTLTVELKQARVMDAIRIDFVSGELVERDVRTRACFSLHLLVSGQKQQGARKYDK